MARTPRKTSSDGGVDPLFALATVIYGDGQKAPAKSIFVPVSQEEYDDCINMTAARPLTAGEQALAEKTVLAKRDAVPATPTDKASKDAEKSDDEIS